MMKQWTKEYYFRLGLVVIMVPVSGAAALFLFHPSYLALPSQYPAHGFRFSVNWTTINTTVIPYHPHIIY
jgi:hypothetical protein